MNLSPQWYSTYQKLEHHPSFSLNTLHYDGANLWNKFYHTIFYKEPNQTKAKLKKLLQMHFLDTSA